MEKAKGGDPTGAKIPQTKLFRVAQVFAAQAHECVVYPILIGNALDIGIVRRVRR
jgi:hypothetical protein